MVSHHILDMFTLNTFKYLINFRIKIDNIFLFSPFFKFLTYGKTPAGIGDEQLFKICRKGDLK